MAYLFIGLVGVILLAVLALKLTRIAKAPAAASAVVSRPILSENEREFFHRLQRALPSYYVFPQVAANALLKVATGVPQKRYHATRNRFAQKHVDFVVCHRDSLDVVAIVELDDRTHQASKDALRDEMFGGAGYKTYRFESRRKPSDNEIAALFGLPLEADIEPPLLVTLDRQDTNAW